MKRISSWWHYESSYELKAEASNIRTSFNIPTHKRESIYILTTEEKQPWHTAVTTHWPNCEHTYYAVEVKHRDIPLDVLLAYVPQTATQSNLSQLVPNTQTLCPTMLGLSTVSATITTRVLALMANEKTCPTAPVSHLSSFYIQHASQWQYIAIKSTNKSATYTMSTINKLSSIFPYDNFRHQHLR